MRRKFTWYLFILIVTGAWSCKNNNGNTSGKILFKGIYSFGPEMKTFTECNSGQEYWVADGCKQLELQYTQLKFEKPYEPVYIEIEGVKIHSGRDGLGSEYDTTLVVNKLIKI